MATPPPLCRLAVRTGRWPPRAIWVVLLAAGMLLKAQVSSASTDEDVTVPVDDGDGDGVLALLHSLVRATASRLSGLVLGQGAVTAADEGDGDEVDDDELTPVVARVSAGRVRYHGYQLVRVHLRSRKQAGQLKRLVEGQQEHGAQLWQHARRNRTADVLLSPIVAPLLKDSLDDMGLSYNVIAADVQKIISFQNPRRVNQRRRTDHTSNRKHPFTWKRYHRYDDIVSYLYYLASSYPHLAQVLPIGTSSEGRPLYVLKVSGRERRSHRTDVANATRRHSSHGKKPAIWIDAGSHGREWISPAVAVYLCMQLVERLSQHPHLVRDADWYILPVLNPDGYEYSHTTDRLWRKTRSSHELPTGRLFSKRGPCIGVDLNRNWDFNWGDREGASDNPCSESYAGPRPFSEPESRAAAAFIQRRRERLQVFVSLHSYSQLWLLPTDASYKRLPDHQELHNKALKAVKAMRRVRNTIYHIGTASEMLYHISGCADNWAKSVAGIKYSYTVELPDRGRYGFLLPAHFIVPTGKEAFAALKVLAESVACKL